MKKKFWLIPLSLLALVLLAHNIGVTRSSNLDSENAGGNTFTTFTSTLQTQTTQPDFNAGVLNQVDTSASPGDVKLALGNTWYDPGWAYRNRITIDHTKVSGTDQSDFPVLISCTYTDWKDTTNSGCVGQSDGGDILFTSSNGTTKIFHEIERYTPSTGELIAWVKVPILSASTDTVFYIYYGNASCADQWNINSTWNSNYMAVWHLKEATGSDVADSTSNGHTGAQYNSPTQTAANIGSGLSFNGSSQYIVTTCGESKAVTSFTWSVWFETDSTTFAHHLLWEGVTAGNGWGPDQEANLSFGYPYSGGGYNDRFSFFLGSADAVTESGTIAISSSFTNTSDWHYAVVTVTGLGTSPSATLYVDGNSVGSDNGTTTSTNRTSWNNSLRFGNCPNNGSPTRYYDGLIDEVRVSDIARSAEWIATEYNNQESPSAFCKVEGIEFNSPSGNTGGWTNPSNAYADGGGYANITSGTPSASQSYNNYGFSIAADATITGVKVRTDASSVGLTGQLISQNPTANTNGILPWTNPANGYTSNNFYTTVSPTYNATTSKNPTANSNGTYPWTNPASGYTSNNLYATATVTAQTSNNPTANTDGTNPWTNPANAYSSNNAYATAVTQIPAYRAVGTTASSTGAVTPPLPSGMSANDVCILVASTVAEGSMSITDNGSISAWYAVPGTPIDVTGGEKLYAWWGVWSSGTTGPSITPGGDHAIARIAAYYNVNTTSPIDGYATGTETWSDSSFSFSTGISSTYNQEVAIAICTTGFSSTFPQFSNWANFSLTSVTERMDSATNNGTGGGFGLVQGTKIAAGTLGTFTATLSNASPKAYVAFALQPPHSNVFDQVFNAFGIIDPGSGSSITKVELGYEAFATATQKLDFYTSADGGSTWSSVHTTANLPTFDPGSYTYIDVTADQSWTWTLLNDSNFKCKIVTSWMSGTPTWSVDSLVVRVTIDYLTYSQTYGTLGITDPGTDSTITKVEVGYEAFATATQKLNLYTSANGGSNWSSAHTTTNLLTSDPNSYTYMDITADQTWTWTLLDDTNFKVRVDTLWLSGNPTFSVDALVVRVTYDDRRPRDQIYGTFGISRASGGTITKVELGYEAFATATQKLDFCTSADGGSTWSSVHTTVNLPFFDPGSYTYIDVTADQSWTWTLLNDSNFKCKMVTDWMSGTPTWSVDAIVIRITYNQLNDDQIRVAVSWDGGTSWSSNNIHSLTDTENTFWDDATGATSWTAAKLSNSNFVVKVDAYTLGDAGDVRLDWLPVQVTYTRPEYFPSGGLASQVLDSGTVGARWDTLCWDETLLSSTSIELYVRASDTLFAKEAVSPSWTPVGGTSPAGSGLPAGRFKQWRANLITSDSYNSPTLSEVRVYYH